MSSAAGKRKLGKNQEALLECLRAHGYWDSRSGWMWDTESNTRKMMDALVARGVARKTRQRGGRIVYRPVSDKDES